MLGYTECCIGSIFIKRLQETFQETFLWCLSLTQIWLFTGTKKGSLTWDLLSVYLCVCVFLLEDAVPAAVSELIHVREEGNMRTAE